MKWMSLKEVSKTIRRRLEMMDIDNYGKTEKMPMWRREQCKQVRGEGLNNDWLEEMVDIGVI